MSRYIRRREAPIGGERGGLVLAATELRQKEEEEEEAAG